jgi:Putative transposase, YhgA-like
MSKKKQNKDQAKTKQNIQNVHDKFFKETFSRVEVVQNFIEETLPVEYKSKINLQNLVLSKDSFIDTSLEEHLADLVYKTTFEGQEVLVTLLFEHKSYIDSFPHWQLLRYMTNIWELEQKQKQKPSLATELTTFNHIKGMLEEGFNADTIAKVFKLPIKKVQDTIQKIKDSNQ